MSRSSTDYRFLTVLALLSTITRPVAGAPVDNSNLTFDERVDRGQSKYDEGNYVEAIEEWNEALRIKPNQRVERNILEAKRRRNLVVATVSEGKTLEFLENPQVAGKGARKETLPGSKNAEQTPNLRPDVDNRSQRIRVPSRVEIIAPPIKISSPQIQIQPVPVQLELKVDLGVPTQQRVDQLQITQRTQPNKLPLYHQWWFWTALGAGFSLAAIQSGLAYTTWWRPWPLPEGIYSVDLAFHSTKVAP